MNAAMHPRPIPATSKAFCTLRAQFALIGYGFYRTDSIDGSVTFYAANKGQLCQLPTLEAARHYLVANGGTP